jgi:hypothetical protein
MCDQITTPKKCEQCGREIEPSEEVVWLFDYPHHVECAEDVAGERSDFDEHNTLNHTQQGM